MSTRALSFVMLLGAQDLQPPFDDDYAVFDLGAVPGLPSHYGGLTFLEGDSNSLLIGGHAARSDVQREVAEQLRSEVWPAPRRVHEAARTHP